jgi:hypothetical protein
MTRPWVTVLLVLGVVFGFGSAFGHHRFHDRRDEFEHRITGLCAEAALKAKAREGAPKPAP